MNLYKTTEPSVISFSGGRTSAYMLWKVLDAYDGILPDNIKVCFANTGREMPETLDFVQACSDNWGVDITWLERYAELAPANHKRKYLYTTKEVDHATAARDGEPFLSLLRARRYAPNPVARFCTVELKITPIKEWLLSQGWQTPYVGYIGIRADEQIRARKMHKTVVEGQERYLPLYLDKVTRQDIYQFWKSNTFDLQLPNYNGITDWGNCDLCFLKGLSKKLAIIRERPSLADWWIKAEDLLRQEVGKEAYFRSDQPSYEDMKIIATTQSSFDFGDDETIPCFCGE